MQPADIVSSEVLCTDDPALLRFRTERGPLGVAVPFALINTRQDPPRKGASAVPAKRHGSREYGARVTDRLLFAGLARFTAELSNHVVVKQIGRSLLER